MTIIADPSPLNSQPASPSAAAQTLLPFPQGSVEQIARWASIAYGSGFLIVMLHTWRLGMPIVDLFRGIYIWIGLPLAVFGYFARRLECHWRARLVAHRNELTGIIAREFPANGAGIALPFWFPRPWLRWWLRRVFSAKMVSPKKKSVMGNLEQVIDRLVKVGLRLYGFWHAVSGFVQVWLELSILLLVLGAYVWFAYPKIPQGLGGGASLRVQLILDGAKVPTNISRALGGTQAWGKDSPPFTTSEMHLLYKTSEGVWLKPAGKGVVFLDKTSILGISFLDGTTVGGIVAPTDASLPPPNR